MRILSLLALLTTAACSTPSSSSTPETPPGSPPKESTTESTDTQTKASSLDAKNGSSCPCDAPYQCIHVVGRNPESGRDECWIPCPNDTPCPTGLTCTMMYDGPGHVCVDPND